VAVLHLHAVEAEKTADSWREEHPPLYGALADKQRKAVPRGPRCIYSARPRGTGNKNKNISSNKIILLKSMAQLVVLLVRSFYSCIFLFFFNFSFILHLGILCLYVAGKSVPSSSVQRKARIRIRMLRVSLLLLRLYFSTVIFLM